MKTRAEIQKAYRDKLLRENPESARAIERERWHRRYRKNRLESNYRRTSAAAVQHYGGGNKQNSTINKMYLVDERALNSISQQTDIPEKQYKEDRCLADQSRIDDVLNTKIKWYLQRYLNCDVEPTPKKTVVTFDGSKRDETTQSSKPIHEKPVQKHKTKKKKRNMNRVPTSKKRAVARAWEPL